MNVNPYALRTDMYLSAVCLLLFPSFDEHKKNVKKIPDCPMVMSLRSVLTSFSVAHCMFTNF